MNKSFCIKCREKNSWWNKPDDDRWENGEVICYLPPRKKFTASLEKPPECCPFALEHVLEKDNNVKTPKKRQKSIKST